MNSSNTQILEAYLTSMGAKLDCYFTVEDQPGPQGAFPWIRLITAYQPDFDIATIDALVSKLDQELEGVKVVRSTSVPSVVHLIAESLIEEGYVLDAVVTTEYSGVIGMLADHLGTLLDGKIKDSRGSPYPWRFYSDGGTEIEIAAEDETVRDVLTRAVPLEGYDEFLWEAGRFDPGSSVVFVTYGGPKPALEELIANAGLKEYLREMGNRLDCYFTIEDRDSWDVEHPLVGPQDERGWILDAGNHLAVDLEVPTIDALVDKLNQELNAELEGDDRIEVVRSTKYPSVVHLIRKSLLQQGYVMQDHVTLQFEGHLGFLADALGEVLDGRIGSPDMDAGTGLPGAGGLLPEVVVSVENESVRDVLTGAVVLEEYGERVLWRSGRFEINGSDKVAVRYIGVGAEVND